MPYSPTDSPEYYLFPRIVTEGWSGSLRLGGDYHHTKLLPGAEYSYEIQSSFFAATGHGKKTAITGKAKASDLGELFIPFKPDITGEWLLRVSSEMDNRKNLPLLLGLYVLQKSLSPYRAFIGDLHSHSMASDGVQEPAYPPMRARTFGYDFFALTDHRNFAPSVEMIKTVGKKTTERFKKLRKSFRRRACYRGWM